VVECVNDLNLAAIVMLGVAVSMAVSCHFLCFWAKFASGQIQSIPDDICAKVINCQTRQQNLHPTGTMGFQALR